MCSSDSSGSYNVPIKKKRTGDKNVTSSTVGTRRSGRAAAKTKKSYKDGYEEEDVVEDSDGDFEEISKGRKNAWQDIIEIEEREEEDELKNSPAPNRRSRSGVSRTTGVGSLKLSTKSSATENSSLAGSPVSPMPAGGVRKRGILPFVKTTSNKASSNKGGSFSTENWD